MSIHKNYVEGYGRNWEKLCEKRIIPHEQEIFKLFSEKFYEDAKKDGERGRKKLEFRGNHCAEICNQIHIILGGNKLIDGNLKELINNIVNLDYDSLNSFFQTLEDKYVINGNQEISDKIADICTHLGRMRKISKKHTTIKKS